MSLTLPRFVVPTKTASAVSAFCLACVGFLHINTAFAEPIDIKFDPPAITVEHQCFSQKSDAEILKYWSAWDEVDLPNWEPNQIAYDMRRLRDKNAREYFDKIAKIIELMPTVKTNYSKNNRDQDLVRLFVSAGRTKELLGTGLVEGLLSSADAGSPGMQNYVADILMKGELVPKDVARAHQLKVRAAYGGNADALLFLAGLEIDGQKIPNWNVDPKIAATMAFGALVGKLDGGFCGRVSRIAREFAQGNLVKQNHYTSEAWYQIIADMGDLNAAWKVAEYHLQGQDIEKNNETLLKYLKISADGGLAQAQLVYGRILETGAIVEQNLELAREYYRRVANSGNRAGNIRIVRLIEEQTDFKSANRAEYKAELRKLVNTVNAPGWAFTRLSRLIVEDEGRWAAEEEVLTLLEEAVRKNDSDGKRDLVTFLLHHRHEPEKFGRSLDMLDDLVFSAGAISPMAELYRIHVCVDPDGPNIYAADYWKEAEVAAGNTTLLLEKENVLNASTKYEPENLARVQTQALYERPNGLAIYLQILKDKNTSPDQMTFWKNVAEKVRNFYSVDARLHRELSGVNYTKDEHDISSLLSALTVAIEKGETQAELDFAEVVMIFKSDNSDLMTKAKNLLYKNAKRGKGRAIELLIELSKNDGFISVEELHSQYGEEIEKRGDFGAQLFLADLAKDKSTKAAYYERAVSIIPCTFKNVVKLIEFAKKNPDIADVEHWYNVADTFTHKSGWNNVVIGDLRWDDVNQDSQEIALASFEKARKLNDDTGRLRLLSVYGTNFGERYNKDYASELFVELLENSAAEDLSKLLSRLKKATPEIENSVKRSIDVFALYEIAAQVGHPAIMREYGLLLRQQAAETGDIASIQEANTWLEKAADANDQKSMLLMAEAYSLGLGVNVSRSKAIEWLELASKSGAEEADRLLAVMKLMN